MLSNFDAFFYLAGSKVWFEGSFRINGEIRYKKAVSKWYVTIVSMTIGKRIVQTFRDMYEFDATIVSHAPHLKDDLPHTLYTNAYCDCSTQGDEREEFNLH